MALAIVVYVSRSELYEFVLVKTSASRTVDERVDQYGAAVRKRLKPFFAARYVRFPPDQLVLVAIKSTNQLEVYASDNDPALRLIRTYPILAASGNLGPKLREGDEQVPEGVYRIELLNPNSLYHLSLRVGYPNAFDRAQAVIDHRTQLGGDIMIHGKAVSVGCLAMGDEAAEDLFVLAARVGIKNIKVIIAPVDFRTEKLTAADIGMPDWVDALYTEIARELGAIAKSGLEKTATVPDKNAKAN
jgi:hypothetical protein